MSGFERNIGKIQESGIKKPDISNGEKIKKISDINKKTKEKVEIFEFLDDLEIPENKQKEYLKKIIKYNIFDKAKNAFDENDLIEIIKKSEVREEKAEVKEERIKKENFLGEIKNIKTQKDFVLNKNKKEVSETKEEVSQTKEEVSETKEEVSETKEEVSETKEEVSDKIEYQESFEKYKSLINFLSSQNLDHSKGYWPIIDSLIKNFDKKGEKFEIEDIETELEKLKNTPELFVSLADDLGGPESGEYKEFKKLVLNTNVGNDFSKLFSDYEGLEKGEKLSASEVIEGIEKENGGIIDIDLKHRPPVNKLRLFGSNYGFDKEIDKKALEEITDGSREELEEIDDKGFGILNEFLKNLDNKNAKLNELEELYNTFDIEEGNKISYNDFEDFKNAETPEEKKRIFKEKLEPKLLKIKQVLIEKRALILNRYKEDIKALLSRKKERNEKELKVLNFLHKTGFDLIPQSLTDRLIKEIQSNKLNVMGLNLNPKRLDLKNGIFGETSTESNGTKWQENFIDFLNKLIYGEINPVNSPLKKEDFISPLGASINPTEIQEIFKKQEIKSKSGLTWNINKMRENLSKQK